MKIHEYNEMMRHLTRREPSDKHLAAMPLYEQGGRVQYKPGGLVEPGVVNYAKKDKMSKADLEKTGVKSKVRYYVPSKDKYALSTKELDKNARWTGKYKVELFDSVKEREAFAKKRLEMQQKVVKDLQQKSIKAQAKIDKHISNWTKNWFEKNTKNFKVGNYDDAIAKLAKDWGVESKKAIYQSSGIWKRGLTTEGGIPILRDAKIFGMDSPDMVKSGQFKAAAQERVMDKAQAYYKRVFHSGLLKNSKLRNNVKDFMSWAAKDKTGMGWRGLLAKASDWLTEDTIKLMGEIDESVLPGKSRGEILRYHFPKTADTYLKKINRMDNMRTATENAVEKLAGVEKGYIRKSLEADRRKLRKIFNTEKLPLAFKYSGDHLLGLREAQILKDPKFAKQAIDNLIGRTFAQNSELGGYSFGNQRRGLIKEFANPKTTSARKAKIVERLNILSDEFIPGEVKYSLGAKNNLISNPLKIQSQPERFASYFKEIAKTKEGAAAIKKQHGSLKGLLQEFCGYTRSGGGRIGFNKGSCSPEVAQRNFLMATDDVAKGRVTGKAAEQITKNAGKIVAKAGSKSALMSILGPAGLGLDIAFEIGSIGTDMAMDSNVTLKGALQNNWLTGFFMKGTGQEEYHKGLFAKDSSAKPFGTAMDLYAKIEEEERALKRMTTGSDRVTVTEEMLSAQKQKIADLASFFDKLARKEGGRYLALEKGSPEQVAYERAKQEYDSTGAAKALLKRTSKADFEDSLKTSRTKPYEDYIKTLNPTYGVKHTYGNISKKEIDKMLKAYGDEQGFGWTPYGLGYGMEQRYTQPGIGDRKYNEDLAYRQLAEDITNTQARSAIAEAGGVANMAAGGRVPLSKAGSVDKARRAFLKWLAGLTGAAVAGGTGFIKLGKGAKTVAPKVTEEVIKRGADGMPTYIDNLINVVQSKGIKKLVDSNINKMPDTVHTYKGVEITQDAAGNTRIKKGKEISVSGSDEPGYHELEMEINRGGIGVKDEGLETQKTFQEPDEYLEGTVRPDIDGKMKDVDFHIDDADHIELKKIADEGTYDTYLPDIDDID